VGADPAREGLDDRGAGAPDDVEAGDGVAVAGRDAAAAFRPPDQREERDALLDAATGASRRRRSRGRPRPTCAASGPPRGRTRRCPSSPGGRARSCRRSACGAARASRPGRAHRRTRTPDRRGSALGSWSTTITLRPASAASAVATSPASPPPTTMMSATPAGSREPDGGGLSWSDHRKAGEGKPIQLKAEAPRITSAAVCRLRPGARVSSCVQPDNRT
jgi:hypothetical protein